MKVVHVNQTDVFGGAALAAWRLHRQLLKDGHDSRLLVGQAGETDPHTFVSQSPASRVERLFARVLAPRSLHNLHRVSSLALPRHPAVRTADVVELHNIRQAFSYAMVPWLALHKPLVWVLHDMWAFTGHCAYSMGCERWTQGCGSCPDLAAFPAMERDFSHAEFTLKRFLFNARSLQLVTPSRWLREQLPRSLLASQPVEVIHNGVDLETFCPERRESARSRLGIPADTTVLLVASDDLNNPRKAIGPWIAALAALAPAAKDRCLILTMGKNSKSGMPISDLDVKAVGVLTDERAKADFYAAGDILLFPSHADNLPLVPIEAVACGTPVLSVAVGGIPEIVVPGRSGWLLDSLEPGAFVQQLDSLLTEPGRFHQLRASSRALAEQLFDVRCMSKAYAALYERLLARKAVVA